MTPKGAFWKWSLIGLLVAGFLVLTQANAVDGFRGLLQVGEASTVDSLIEEQLGEVPRVPQLGHDTQVYYAIGLDLAGDEVPELIDHAPYRYRRILYPAVASLLGVIEGEALLAAMVVITIASAAAASGLTAAIAVRQGRSDWVALAVLLNPGVWLGVRLITADIMALAFMLLGVYWLLMGRKWAAPISFALSGLAKEIFLITPGALAISHKRQRWRLILVPMLAITAWMAWLALTMGSGLTDGRGNVGLPLLGMIEAFDVWQTYDAKELFYLVFALASVAVGLVFSVFNTWLRWPILSWSLLGLMASRWVWDLGNNAARVLAPILILVAIAGFVERPTGAAPEHRSKGVRATETPKSSA